MAYSRNLSVMDDFHGLFMTDWWTNLYWYLLSCYRNWKINAKNNALYIE